MTVPEWFVDLSVPAMVIVGAVVVAVYYIREVASKKGPTPCSTVIMGPMRDLVEEFRESQKQQRKDQEAIREAFQEQTKLANQQVITLVQMCGVMTETLTRVKDVEKSVK